MGGPIVRTGTTPEFWSNWDRVFAGKKGAAKPADAKPASKKSAKVKAKAPKGAKKKK